MALEPGQTCSPPDVECAVGAIPGTAHGKLVIDGSITHPYIGLVKQPIVVYIEDSYCTKITGLVDGVEQDTEAVSYTHLDVYKRQRWGSVRAGRPFFVRRQAATITGAPGIRQRMDWTAPAISAGAFITLSIQRMEERRCV